MGSGKREKHKNPGKKNNLKPKNPIKKSKKNKKNKTQDSKKNTNFTTNNNNNKIEKKQQIIVENISSVLAPKEQLSFFIDRLTNGAHLSSLELEPFQEERQIVVENISRVLAPKEQLSFVIDRLINGSHLSSLELESFQDTCLVELSHDLDQSADNLVEHMKVVFGSSWKEMLCEKKPVEGIVEPGNPSLIVISLSALRSLEVHRALRPLTRECPAAKLFSKHMKVEEQVHFLKSRVNIACGTPSRIKKLIDIEVLCLKRLKVIVLDMHTDVKGYSLFSLPQIRDEFWELYRSYFHQPIVQGDIRVCLYGPTQDSSYLKKKSC